jgi:hypothetical protein
MGVRTSPAPPTPAVKGMLQFCRRACRVPHGTKADLRPNLLCTVVASLYISHAEGRDGDGERQPALFDNCIHSERE